MLDTLNFVTTFLSKLFNIPSIQNVKMGQERTDAACYARNPTLKGMSDHILLKLSTVRLFNRT